MKKTTDATNTAALHDGVNSVKKLAVMLAGVPALVAELEKIGPIENAAADAQGRLDRLRADESTAKTRLDEATRAIADAEAIAAQRLNEARRQASEIMTGANEGASGIIATARTNAAEIEREARERAAEIDAQAAARRAEVLKLDAAIQAGQKRLSEVEAALANARTKLGVG